MQYTVADISDCNNGNQDYVWVSFAYTRNPQTNVVYMPERKLCLRKQVEAVGLAIGDVVEL
jgi:hypothetical protein